jgi:hypothetical protein
MLREIVAQIVILEILSVSINGIPHSLPQKYI